MMLSISHYVFPQLFCRLQPFSRNASSISLYFLIFFFRFTEKIPSSVHIFQVLFFFQWLFQPIQCPGLLFSSVIILHRRYDSLGDWAVRRKAAAYTQDNTNTNVYTDIHALSGIRTHDPRVRAREDSSCLRRRGYCDRHSKFLLYIIY
jgi:hypothetical protein